MSSTVITVENLSKLYILKHRRQGGYTALRDVITEKTKSFFKKKNEDDFKEREEFLALNNISSNNSNTISAINFERNII